MSLFSSGGKELPKASLVPLDGKVRTAAHADAVHSSEDRVVVDDKLLHISVQAETEANQQEKGKDCGDKTEPRRRCPAGENSRLPGSPEVGHALGSPLAGVIAALVVHEEAASGKNIRWSSGRAGARRSAGPGRKQRTAGASWPG